jgi:uncharacterized damage-inducible protein DinB
MKLVTVGRPAAAEYDPYWERYISLVGDDALSALDQQSIDTCSLFRLLSEEQGNYSYAPGKWTIKEMIGHMIDTERIFAYRALRIGRGDETPLPGFEQDDYVPNSGYARLPLADVIAEFEAVRQATRYLVRHFPRDAWMRMGTASGKQISVRALVWIIAGHELYHRKVLAEKYGVS